MEGWLYGLFTLLGVLAGGLFTYLGMKKQLEQQRELDSCQWRRKVRSEPLFQLRKELARMVSRYDRYAGAVELVQFSSILGKKEEAMKELEKAYDNWKASSTTEELTLTLGMLGDEELAKKVRDIWADYAQKSYAAAMLYKDAAKRSDAIKDFETIRTNIAKVQELINKRLEEL